MKRATIFLFLFFCAVSGFANRGVYTDTVAKIPGAPEMLQQIIDATGLQPNFKIKAAKVMNVEAVIAHRQRYIYYNPEYIARLNQLVKNKWAAMALLAHEVGHHLNGHTIKKGGSSPQLELEADEFAGFILYQLGASLEESQEVMNYIAQVADSDTHPGRQSRLQAIEKGWNRGNAARLVSKPPLHPSTQP